MVRPSESNASFQPVSDDRHKRARRIQACEPVDSTTNSYPTASIKAIRKHEKLDSNPLSSMIPELSCLEAPPETRTEAPVPSPIKLLARRDDHFFVVAAGFTPSAAHIDEGAARAYREPSAASSTDQTKMKAPRKRPQAAAKRSATASPNADVHTAKIAEAATSASTIPAAMLSSTPRSMIRAAPSR